jgi:hypothetical protein
VTAARTVADTSSNTSVDEEEGKKS